MRLRFAATVATWSVIWFIVFALVFNGCSLINPTTGEDQVGLPTAVTAEVLRGLADDVELWDVNKDGVNTDQELLALGLAASQRLIVAWQAAQLEAATVPDIDR